MHIAAIMPCRGRAGQTITNVKRLLATAGYEDWRLICVIDGDPGLFTAFRDMPQNVEVIGSVKFADLDNPPTERVGYWRSLAVGTEWLGGAPFLVNLANDILPGQHWLGRAADAYRETFGPISGLLGFNDGHHEVGHSCHFLISRSLLDRYGGWPIVYRHDYGDTEICQRAIADGVYAKAPWATLYHNHPFFGAENMDAVYQEGRASSERDRRLYEQRKRQGWPAYVMDAR